MQTVRLKCLIYLPTQVVQHLLQQLLALAGRLAAERGKRASCSVNFPQAVIQLEFSEAPQESITIQQANEGEAAPETQTVSE